MTIEHYPQTDIPTVSMYEFVKAHLQDLSPEEKTKLLNDITKKLYLKNVVYPGSTLEQTLSIPAGQLPDPDVGYDTEREFIHTFLYSLENSGWQFVKPSDRPDIEYRDAYVALKRALYASQTKLEKK